MNWKAASLGLGVFSIALGAAELLAGRRIARVLDAEEHHGLVRGFGVREILAGVTLLQAPAASSGAWNRVGGDAMDALALAAAARRSPRNRLVWSALAFVAGAALLDVLVARRLDETTGKTFPTRESAPQPA